MNYQYLTVRTKDRVGWIKYNRPPVNAFNWEMLREVPAALKALLKDPKVRVIVFASANWLPTSILVRTLKPCNHVTGKPYLHNLSFKIAVGLQGISKIDGVPFSRYANIVP